MTRKLSIVFVFVLAATVARAQNYPTNFPAIENPISQSGAWVNGANPGVNWGNMQTFAGGHVGGTNTNPGCSVGNPTACNDSVAALTGTWTVNQAVCSTVFIDPTLSRTSGTYEIELHTHQTITSASGGTASGYEFNYSLFNNGNQYMQIVRWNGALGSFTQIGGTSGTPVALNNGDIFCASSAGSTHRSWLLRGGSIIQTTNPVIDTTFTGGAPGLGTFNGAGTLADNAKFGFSQWEAVNAAAQTCNSTDVNNVTNGPTHTAVNGESILVPPGACTWTSTSITANNIGVQFLGYGIPNASPLLSGASNSCTATAITTVGSSDFKFFGAIGNSLARVSCMASNYGGAPASIFLSALGACNGSGCTNIRMDNVTFNNWSGHAEIISFGINAIGDYFGVIDHNTVNGNAGSFLELVEANHASYQGVGQNGDNSWAQPENYGSNNFLFFENNSMVHAGCCENEGNFGGLVHQGGGRVISRFDTYTLADTLQGAMGWHGTESSGRPRGGRTFEFYGGTINYPVACAGSCAQFIGIRSGTGLGWGNTINTVTTNAGGINLTTALIEGTTGGWAACDGTAAKDGNDPAGVQFTGTILSGVGNTNPMVLTISGSPGWATNQWVPAGAPYSMHDVTASATKLLSVGSQIQSNTSNTLSILNDGGPASLCNSNGCNIANGDTIQITRAFWCMDQAAGRGAGTLFSGASQNFGPSTEVLSPAYFWMLAYPNQVPGGIVGTPNKRVIQNRDYYIEQPNQAAQTSPTSPFDGTTTLGFGHGTLANRPTTCTVGVGYWANDQGSWNTSGRTFPDGSSQGQLYLCTATNVWTLKYTPFSYPHPLITGNSSGGTPSVSFSPTSVAFGNVLVGSTSPQKLVTLTNIGTGPLAITGISLTGTNPADFAQTNNCGTGVTAGGSCTITATCTPLSAASFSASVSVSDNAAGSPQTVPLTCTGVTATPGIGFAPTSIAFAARTVGTSSSPTAVTVTNTGSATLTITSVTIVGGNSTSFSQTNNCGSVAPAGNCTINVTFTPQIAGALSSNVSVVDNAAGSPQTVPLTGTGNGVAGIGFNPTGLSFGNQTVSSTSAALTTTVTNTGTASLTLTSITLTGTNSGDFSISANTCGGSLAVGANCSISVTFTPGAAGARTANLTFTDNAPASPQNVALSGTGTQAGTSFNPSSLGFGIQNVNTTSAAQTVTLTNTGSATLNISAITITGTNAADFAISAKTCGIILTASGTCTVSVTFTPSTTSTRTANLTFTDDAPASPQAVPLQGTGAATSVQISPASLTFPATVVGQTSATQQLQVSNTGTTTINITSILVSGGNAADFSIPSTNCGNILGAGTGCTVNVAFSPTATGARASAIVLTDSAPGSPQSAAISGTGTQAGAQVAPTVINFPATPAGGTSAPVTVTLTNNGTATLNITSISLAPTDTYFTISGSTCGSTLGSGLNCTVSVEFVPQTAGNFTFTLSFVDTGPNSPQKVTGGGQGTTVALSFNPAALSFGSVNVGTQSGPQTISMMNSGNGIVTISGITITGTNPGDYSQTNNCPPNLSGGGSCTITVKFLPTASGARSANVQVTDNAPGSPQTVALSGTGVTPTAGISLSPTSLTFASQGVGTSSASQPITVSNPGSANLVISGISISGDYSQTNNCTTVAPAGNCTVNVTFSPTTTGTRTGTLTINDNAGGSPHTAPLSGTGAAAAVSFVPASLTFPSTAVSVASAPLTTTLQNTGGASLTSVVISIVGTNASNFTQTNNCGSTVLAGGSCTINVTFTPSANGVRTASVQVVDNIGTQTVSLQGTGFTPTPVVGLSAASLVFGNQTTGTASNQRVVILTNTGTASLTISSTSITGTNAGDFGVTTTCGGSLVVNASCAYQFTFMPSAAGARSATFNLNTNAASSPDHVSLSGTGVTSPGGSPAPQVFGDD